MAKPEGQEELAEQEGQEELAELAEQEGQEVSAEPDCPTPLSRIRRHLSRYPHPYCHEFAAPDCPLYPYFADAGFPPQDLRKQP